MAIVYLSTDTPLSRRWQDDLARRDADAVEEMAQRATMQLWGFLRPVLGPLVRPIARSAAARYMDEIRAIGRQAEDVVWEIIAGELERADVPCIVARNAVLQAREDRWPLELDLALAAPFGLAVVESKGWRYPCTIGRTDAWLERPRGQEVRKSPLLQLDEARGLLVRARKAAGVRLPVPIYCGLVLPSLQPGQVSFLEEPQWREGWRCGAGPEGAREVGRWLARLPGRPELLEAAAATLAAAMGTSVPAGLLTSR